MLLVSKKLYSVWAYPTMWQLCFSSSQRKDKRTRSDGQDTQASKILDALLSPSYKLTCRETQK